MQKKLNLSSTTVYLWELTAGVRGRIVLLIVVQALIGGNGVLYALFLRDIINTAAAGDKLRFWKSIAAFALLAVVQVGLRAVVRYLDEAVKSLLENRCKAWLLEKLLQQDYAEVSVVHSGEWMNRLTSDTVVVAEGVTQILPGVAGMAVKLVSAATMIVILQWRFALILLPAGLLSLLLSSVFRRRLKQLHKNVQEKDGRLRSLLQEILSGLPVIHAYAAEASMCSCATGSMEAHRKARMQRNAFSNFSNTGFAFLMNGAYVCGAAFCGYEILTGRLDYGTFLAVLQLISQIQTPFAGITGFLPRYYGMIASVERLSEVESYKGRKERECLSGAEILSVYQTEFEEIGVRNLWFSYAGGKRKRTEEDVLKGIRITVKKGEIVALTGASGCGKSTLLQILLCLYEPDAGMRYICRSGMEENLTCRWQKLFAYVPQGNVLMSGSLREILTFSDPGYMKEEGILWKALEIACAKEFVSEWKDTLDTVLGERGMGVSEGQRQRLAIARAVISGGPVLLLDESTSALDGETERAVLSNLRQMTDKTVLIVTHRPAALEICDRQYRFTESGCMEMK